jgi:hypothetical protein
MEYTCPVTFAHTDADPVMTPVVPSVGVTVTVFVAGAPVRQLLLGVTVTSPEVPPKVTVIDVVPAPAVMLAPVGTVHA